MGIYSSTPFVDVFWIFVDPKILFMAFFLFPPPSSEKHSKSQHKKTLSLVEDKQ